MLTHGFRDLVHVVMFWVCGRSSRVTAHLMTDGKEKEKVKGLGSHYSLPGIIHNNIIYHHQMPPLTVFTIGWIWIKPLIDVFLKNTLGLGTPDHPEPALIAILAPAMLFAWREYGAHSGSSGPFLPWNFLGWLHGQWT